MDYREPTLIIVYTNYVSGKVKQRQYYCPICNEFLGSNLLTIKNYCGECGQRLKPRLTKEKQHD